VRIEDFEENVPYRDLFPWVAQTLADDRGERRADRNLAERELSAKLVRDFSIFGRQDGIRAERRQPADRSITLRGAEPRDDFAGMHGIAWPDVQADDFPCDRRGDAKRAKRSSFSGGFDGIADGSA
jgi:hypothetical protein